MTSGIYNAVVIPADGISLVPSVLHRGSPLECGTAVLVRYVVSHDQDTAVQVQKYL